MIMKTVKKIILFTFVLSGLFLVSCTKVIDVDLNSKDPKIVVESNFTAGEAVHRVSVTKTMNFSESGAYPTIDNAVVSVTDDLGNAQVLTFVGNGIYETVGYPVAEGRTYSLTVVADGKTFAASSTVPAVVQIDTILVNKFPFGAEPFYGLVPIRIDPAGVRNFYQFDLFRNDVRVQGIYLQDDEFIDGLPATQPIFDNEGAFGLGDTAKIDMYCIDQPVYNYFFALLQNATATPANPTSNFSGGCLGYFSARSKHTASVIITE